MKTLGIYPPCRRITKTGNPLSENQLPLLPTGASNFAKILSVSAIYLALLFLPPCWAMSVDDLLTSGNAKNAQRNYDGAIADYTQAIALDPKNAMAYHNRGYAKRDKGDNDGAIADYTQVIALDPKFVTAYNNRGGSKGAKGDNDGAIADYTQAIALDPKNAMIYNNRGNAKQEKGDNDGAIADYTQAIAVDPMHAKAYDNRGHLEYDRQTWTDALMDFRKALEFTKPGGKDIPYYHIRIWFIRARLGERTAATQELQGYWTGQSAQNAWPLPIMAYLTGRISDQALLAKARAADEKTTKDQLCEASFYIGSRRLIEGDQKRAQQALEQAVQRCPHGFEYRSAVAELAAMKNANAGTRKH